MTWVLFRITALSLCGWAAPSPGAELWIGTAHVSITPDRPVALWGQMHTRVAQGIDNPVTATALALETRDGQQVLDQAVMVSCDLAAIRSIQDKFRARLGTNIPGLDLKKLFLNATHTHTGPVTEPGFYEIPKDAMQPEEYVEFLFSRLEEVVAAAWKNRKPGGVSWGLGHAVVGHNRRAVHADGSGKMYGSAATPDFRHFEGYEDHGVEMLFFWDKRPKLIAVAVNVACPAQEVESRSTVNADFWHDVRVQLRRTHGEQLQVLGWIGAGGDQSPHLQYRKAAEERMMKLRGLTRTEEIARRICQAVDDVAELARRDIRGDVPLVHRVETLELPVRKVTEAEAENAKRQIAALADKPNLKRRMIWHQNVVDRFRDQDRQPTYAMELHAIRLGDVAICTNPFEMFVDYGVRIKARSKAIQTFVIQLACGSGYYLATDRAVKAGGYSAIVESNLVSPEGGQLLVERTVEAINRLW